MKFCFIIAPIYLCNIAHQDHWMQKVIMKMMRLLTFANSEKSLTFITIGCELLKKFFTFIIVSYGSLRFANNWSHSSILITLRIFCSRLKLCSFLICNIIYHELSIIISFMTLCSIPLYVMNCWFLRPSIIFNIQNFQKPSICITMVYILSIFADLKKLESVSQL